MIIINSYSLAATLQAAKPSTYNDACRAQFTSIPGIQWDGKAKHYVGDPIAISAALELCEEAKIAIVKRSSDIASNAIQPPTVFDPRTLEFQKEGICALNQILHDYGAAMLLDEMGCIDGDATIRVNRAKRGFGVKLSKLFDKFNAPGWDHSIPTKVRALCNGTFRLHTIRAVLDKGVKPVVKLTLASGKTLRLTPKHEVATPGGFTAAQDLIPGDAVLTNGQVACKLCGTSENVCIKPSSPAHPTFTGYCRACIYRHLRKKANYKGGRALDKSGYVRISGQYNHPRAAGSAYQVLEHHLVMEAHIGRHIAENEIVHHKNGVKGDNRLDNLELLTNVEHMRHHGINGGFAHMHGGVTGKGGDVCFIPKEDAVVSVEPDGKAHVYDIVCEDPYRNFVANSIVVHNCGKTPQAIQLLDYTTAHAPKVIVAPAMVVPTWRRELINWSPLYAQHYQVYSYEEFQSALKLDAPKKRSGKPPLMPLPPNPAAIVFDEAHYLANSSSKRAEAVALYCANNPNMKRLALTGTPFKTYVRSLHCLLDILFPRQFGSFFKFTSRYCDGHHLQINLQGGEERRVWNTDGSSHLDELQARLVLRSIRRTKKEVLRQLPSKRRSVIDVPLPAKVRKAMRDMAKASLLAQELGGSVGRLLSHVEEHKLDAAEQLANECVLQGRKPLILSTRRASAEELACRLRCPVAHGSTAPEERLRILSGASIACSTIDACQVGITLTNFDTIIFVGFDWDPSKLLQAEDRIHRIGQQDSCLIYYLCGESSIDEIVRSKVIDRLEIFAQCIGKEDSALQIELNGVNDEELLQQWAARIAA